MKTLFIAAALATAAVATTGGDYEAMFREFKSTNLKAYANEAEEKVRFTNFVANMKKAAIYQAANPHAEFGANQFADMSEEEFAARYLNEAFFKKAMAEEVKRVQAPLADRMKAAGEKIDWREKGAVTPVKNQGSCGSCWSFSVVANIEGQNFLAGNPLTVLSEQQLVSCDKTNSACSGGLMDKAYTWLLSNRRGQIVTEESYPYVSGGGSNPSCKTSELDAFTVGATIKDFEHLARSEETLAAYVYTRGPMSIGLDATTFQSYRSGIITNCVSRSANHAVLAVGFDDTNVPPYWIVKNSWGSSWGENGYIRVAKGTNQCLIDSYTTTAVV